MVRTLRIRPYLRTTEMTGAAFPCGGCLDTSLCTREIVDYGAGEIVAVCRDQWKRSEDILLSRPDTILHSLDVAALAHAIARPLGFRWHTPVVQGHNTWSIGLAAGGFGTDRQVILMAHSEQERFRMALHQLLAAMSRPASTRELLTSERAFLAAMQQLGFGRYEYLQIRKRRTGP